MKSNFTILHNSPELIVLYDLGPWDTYKTITNDAEAVVQYLYKSNRLHTASKQIVYYDSDGEATQMLHDGNGNFTGFGVPTVSY
jgi:hypothetical protein